MIPINGKMVNNDVKELDLSDKQLTQLPIEIVQLQTLTILKLHNNHLIHGDYLESPNQELCYHFMKDGKYL